MHVVIAEEPLDSQEQGGILSHEGEALVEIAVANHIAPGDEEEICVAPEKGRGA